MRGLINWGVIAGAVAIGLVLLAITLVIVAYSQPTRAPASAPTAVLNVIRAPTKSPEASTPLPASPTPTQNQMEPADSGEILVGGFVQVSGTGGSGLRLRIEPSLQSTIRLLGEEEEIFQVGDGPREADGYTWWYLVSPQDENRHGWAVAEFLKFIQNP